MANFLRHEPCEQCGSKDNLAVYDDDSRHCFTPGCGYRGGATSIPTETQDMGLLDIDYIPLTKRGIKIETCKKWGYGSSLYDGQPVQVANYRDPKGVLKAQKLRTAKKSFRWLGDAKAINLYGEHLWETNGKRVVVVEGEIDALSVSQAFENKWPVVSIPNGAQSAAKAITKSIEWLETFSEVVLCFDQDEAGKAAANACAHLLTPGKCKIVHGLPEKDANECLIKGKVKELVSAIWEAKTFRPDGVVAGEELWDHINKDDSGWSVEYPWAGFNGHLLGMRGGELVTLTAGTGIGKSSVCRELAYHLVQQGHKVGYIALEESVKKTAECLMAIHMNVPHTQMHEVGETQRKEAFNEVLGDGNLVLYDHWGSQDPARLLGQVRYMCKGLGCKFIFLDHLSILVSALEEGDERRMIDNTMTKLRALVEETDAHCVLVSHLKRPDGRGHEEGAATSLSQLRGSHAIAQLSDAVLGCERNQQDQLESRNTSIRVLKNRYAGTTGVCATLEFNPSTGRLNEYNNPFADQND